MGGGPSRRSQPMRGECVSPEVCYGTAASDSGRVGTPGTLPESLCDFIDWRYLFEMPSVRSRTKQFLEMAARFNAKDVGFGGDYVCPGTMMILSDRWEGAERENVMRHELDHQFIFTLGQMMGNENERRRVQGLPHLSDDSLTSLKAKLAKINKKLDSLETFVSTPNGNLKLWGRNDIIEELQSVERDFGKKLKNREENR